MSKITEKIAKLLALAESPYEEEAKAALLQARRLMAEHKLMPEDIEPQENKKVIQECVGVTCTKLSSPWTVYLSTLIAAHYCCRPYRSSVHGSKVSEIGFIGMEDDFKLCKLAFLYAYDCVASRCRRIRTQKGYPAKTLREMMSLSDEARAEMGARGRQLVEEKYSWRAVAEQLIAAYQQVLATPG